MSTSFPRLFSPLAIGDLILHNRIVFQPHNPALASPDGLATEQQARYYAERAKGGASLVIIENAAVHWTGKMSLAMMHAWDPRVVPGWRRLADRVHEAGAAIFGQLNHGGHSTALRPPQLLWAPTQMPEASSRYNCKEMEAEDLEAVIAGFAAGARHYQQAGFDGVEIKAAAHDGLLRSFVSPFFNRRKDAYGDTFERRMRLPIEVLHAMRREVGSDFLLGVRVCLDEFTPWGYGLEYGLDILRAFLATGEINYINTDAGTFSSFYMEVPPAAVPMGFASYLSAAAKQLTNLPVIAFGRLGDPFLAEKILADGEADLIGMCRPLICDPELPRKAEEGRADEIRHCVACNDGCLSQVMQDRPIRCVQNPAAGREAELGAGTLRATRSPKRILVVGGGVAGLRVAAVAAERGHQVTLVEKDPEIGGQLVLASRQPSHEEIGEVVRHLAVMARRHGVEIHLGEEATVESVLALRADCIVVATGSRPAPMEGLEILEGARVYSAEEVLAGAIPDGRRVLVYDRTGHWRGAGTAELLLEKGRVVILATDLLVVGAELEPANRELFYLRVRPKRMEFLASHTLHRVDPCRAFLADVYSGEERIVEHDNSVVLATSGQSNDGLYHALKGRVKELYRVGDCVSPRMVQQAIYESEMLARSI